MTSEYNAHLVRLLEAACDVIEGATAIMSADQVGQWTGVRSVLESIDIELRNPDVANSSSLATRVIQLENTLYHELAALERDEARLHADDNRAYHDVQSRAAALRWALGTGE